MADISQEIKAFQEAIYGEEVRSAMVNLATKVNDEVVADTNNVSNYTASINTKMSQLDTTQTQAVNILTKANKLNTDAITNQELAERAEVNAKASATKAESYAVGNTNSRDGEDLDNAKYYYESAKSAKIDAENARQSAENLIELAKAEVAGYTFWIETDEKKDDAGYLYMNTTVTSNTFGIDTDGYLYVEV